MPNEPSPTFLKQSTGASGGRRFLSICAGLGVSFLILLGIIQAKKSSLGEEGSPVQDLRAVTLSAPPPPPAYVSVQEETPELIELEEEAFEVAQAFHFSPDVELTTLQPTNVTPSFDFSLEAFRPSSTKAQSRNKIYTYAEVDRPPVAVRKHIPTVDPGLLRKMDQPRVTVMYVVRRDGAVQSVFLTESSDPQYDQRIMEAIKKWRFKPAIKGGDQVHCMVRHRITLSRTGESTIEL